jgi:dTDP-4-dehydrorhamnose 3,5-epimerase
MLRNDDQHFQSFGEIYFSVVNPESIKGWHIHKEMTLNYAVPHNDIKFVLYDDRENSSTRGELMELFLDHAITAVSVPPMVWNGLKALRRRLRSLQIVQAFLIQLMKLCAWTH